MLPSSNDFTRPSIPPTDRSSQRESPTPKNRPLPKLPPQTAARNDRPPSPSLGPTVGPITSWSRAQSPVSRGSPVRVTRKAEIPQESTLEKVAKSAARENSPLNRSPIASRPIPIPIPKQNPVTAPIRKELSWKEKGDIFLSKKEFENAMDCYTKGFIKNLEELASRQEIPFLISDITMNRMPQKPVSIVKSNVEVQTPTPEIENVALQSTKLPKKGELALHSFEPVSSPWLTKGENFLAQKKFTEAFEILTDGLKNAEEENQPQLIAQYLLSMSKIFIEQRDYTRAAMLQNSSLALMEKIGLQPQYASNFFKLMAEAEKKFLIEECKVEKKSLEEYPDPKQYSIRRQILSKLRENISKQLNLLEDTDKILSNFSDEMCNFVMELANDCIRILGTPPCSWAMISLGSLSRKEMSPYSDLEFALLIEKETPQVREYFRKFGLLLGLKIIHLGETEFNTLKKGTESATPKGFHLHRGGNSPMAKDELMTTPEKMASLQDEQKIAFETLFFLNILKAHFFLAGDKKLHMMYEEQLQKILNGKCKEGKLLVREKRALHMLQGHLKEFSPKLGEIKEETPVFDIKAELYRLPNILVSTLADYYGLKEKNTWERINALQQIGVFSKEAAEKLKSALRSTMTLRIRAHLFYEEENDLVYHPTLKEKKAILFHRTRARFFLIKKILIQSVISIRYFCLI